MCVTYVLTSTSIPNLKSSDMRHDTVNDVSAPSGISST